MDIRSRIWSVQMQWNRKNPARFLMKLPELAHYSRGSAVGMCVGSYKANGLQGAGFNDLLIKSNPPTIDQIM